MSILLALISALGFGTADFLGGFVSRRLDFRITCLLVQGVGLFVVVVAVLFIQGNGLTGRVAFWGAVAGIGNGFGLLLLYRGLSVGRMGVVATLSALVGSVLPVLFAIAQGDSLSAPSAVGIAIAVPAVALVSWQPAADEVEQAAVIGGTDGSGAIWGLLAGIGLAAYFIALDQAGNDAGVWPSAVGQTAAVLIITPFAARALVGERPRLPRSALATAAFSGILIGICTVALLAALGGGELAIVAVLASLYPGVTILLARFTLAEHWLGTQKLGLITALIAVLLVSAGSG